MSSAEIIMSAMSIAAPIVSVVVAVIVARRNKDKDTKSQGIQEGTVQSDLGYIKAGVDDLKQSNKEIVQKQTQQDIKIAKLETAVKDHIEDKSIHFRKGAK